MADQIHNINVNTIELLAPVSAAILLNTVAVKELIALQKGESFDRQKAISDSIVEWSAIIPPIQDAARKSSSPPQIPSNQ